MPPLSHWIGQYLLAAGTMFALLSTIDLTRGDSLAATWLPTLAWSALAAAFFIGARWRQARRGAACALCRDKRA